MLSEVLLRFPSCFYRALAYPRASRAAPRVSLTSSPPKVSAARSRDTFRVSRVLNCPSTSLPSASRPDHAAPCRSDHSQSCGRRAQQELPEPCRWCTSVPGVCSTRWPPIRAYSESPPVAHNRPSSSTATQLCQRPHGALHQRRRSVDSTSLSRELGYACIPFSLHRFPARVIDDAHHLHVRPRSTPSANHDVLHATPYSRNPGSSGPRSRGKERSDVKAKIGQAPHTIRPASRRCHRRPTASSWLTVFRQEKRASRAGNKPRQNQGKGVFLNPLAAPAPGMNSPWYM